MKTLRIVGATAPQLFLLFLTAGSLGLLGGWQHTDAALSTLAGLFILAPATTAVLLVAELVRYLKRRRSAAGLLLAAGWVCESLLINLYLLSRLRMH